MDISRIYFDRKPPFQEEAILRLEHKKVTITYELQVEKQKQAETVVESEQTTKGDNEMSKQNQKHALKPDKILEKVNELNKIFPNFNTLSDGEKATILADIINGKYDHIIFKETEDDSSNKPVPTVESAGCYTKKAKLSNINEESTRRIDIKS
jgi:hypothetical protein